MPPESWHLSRSCTIIVQYCIHASMEVESTSCELALKPSLYNNNPIIHTIIHLVWETSIFRATTVSPGETPTFHFSRIRCLARGKHPHSTHLSLTRSKQSAAGFREPPNKTAWPREAPYMTISVFHADSVSVVPLYPARAGIPV